MNSQRFFLMCAAVLALATGLSAQSVGDVLINEFCYDSQHNIGSASGPDLEWVELYNTTASTIDLSGWQLADNGGPITLPSGLSIAANGYFVIALTGSAAQYLRYTGWPADYVNTSGWAGLGNSGDGIAIFTPTPTSTCIDYIQYGSGAAVPGAPAWTGTRPNDPAGSNDFSHSRIPNGTNSDTVAGDAGSEAGATSFRAAPFTPGRANGGTVVDVWVPDQYADHYSGTGAVINTLAPRVTTEPLRMRINLPPGFDFNSTSSFGFSNIMAFRARYHDTTATVGVSFSFNAGETTVSTSTLTLPSGGNMPVSDVLLMYVDSLTGQLPNTVGTIVVDVACAITAGATTTFKLEIQVDAPQITPAANLGTIIESQSSQPTIAATGGLAPYTWSIANAPAWASINASTGQLTMSPTTGSAGPHTMDVTVSDSNTPARQDTVTFSVAVAEVLNITTTTLTTIATGNAPGQSVAATGGVAPYTFSLGGAPAWLSINPTTGALSGVAPAAGAYNFNALVSDSGGQNDSQPLTLTVVDSVVITSPATITPGKETEPYSYTFTATGGTAPYAWSATGLPGFLGLNPNTGELSGTPTNADGGTYNLSVTVTDASTPQQMHTLAVTLVVDQLSTVGGGGGNGGGNDGGGCAASTTSAWPLALIALALLRRRQRRS